MVRERQQVVPLLIINEALKPCWNGDSDVSTSPAVILKINDYSVEIYNHAARDTIINTLFVLQQLCQANYQELPKFLLLQAELI